MIDFQLSSIRTKSQFQFELDGKVVSDQPFVSYANGLQSFNPLSISSSRIELLNNVDKTVTLIMDDIDVSTKFQSAETSHDHLCETSTLNMYCIDMNNYIDKFDLVDIETIKANAVRKTTMSTTGCIQHCKVRDFTVSWIACQQKTNVESFAFAVFHHLAR